MIKKNEATNDKNRNDIPDDSFIKAAIDIGTNSCRLLICQVKSEKNSSIGDTQDNIQNNIIGKKYLKVEKILYKTLNITNLGEGVNDNRFLLESAIKRSFDALTEYKKIAKQFNSSYISGFATSAVRDANNRDSFLSLIRNELNINIELISGDTEAELNFIANSEFFKENILIVDIGGGSTEFIFGKDYNINFLKSLDMGAVRITELFFSEEDYSLKNMEKATLWIKKNLDELYKNLNFSKNSKTNFLLVAVAGTANTQASVKLKMSEYNSDIIHNTKITVKDLEDNLTLFLNKTLEERSKITGLHPKRAKVIIGGTLILKVILEYFNKNDFIVSEYDSIYGWMISR